MTAEQKTIIGGAYARGILTVATLVMGVGPDGMPYARIVYVPVYVTAPVFGWPTLLNPVEHSIQEGAIVTNLNFHTASKKPAVASPAGLPGPITAQA